MEPSGKKQQPAQKTETMDGRKRSRKTHHRETTPERVKKGPTEPEKKKPRPEDHQGKRSRKRSRKTHRRETTPERVKKGPTEPEKKKPRPEDHQGKRSRKRSRKTHRRETTPERAKKGPMEPKKKSRPEDHQGNRSRKRSRRTHHRDTRPERAKKGPMEPEKKKSRPEHHQGKRSGKRKWREEESQVEKKKKTESNVKESHRDQQRPGPSSTSPACPRDASHYTKRFNIRREIGRGSYGVVLLAYDNSTMKEVAIKVLNNRGMSDSEKEKALVERRALQATSGSPFLVHSLLTFQTQNTLAFVMGYASGGDLFDLLSNTDHLEIEAATFYAAEMVSGLQYLHVMGFIHRDIKPENILIDDSGHIKIADFGLAVNKIHGARGHAGTRGYIAPEILSGQQYDAGVDWYSFGVVLYDMTSGQFPHVCKISALPGCHLSPNTRDIIKELLCDDPKMRLGVNREIRHHLFFEGIDWVELEDLRVQPPFIPSKPPVKVPPPPQTLEE